MIYIKPGAYSSHSGSSPCSQCPSLCMRKMSSIILLNAARWMENWILESWGGNKYREVNANLPGSGERHRSVKYTFRGELKGFIARKDMSGGKYRDSSASWLAFSQQEWLNFRLDNASSRSWSALRCRLVCVITSPCDLCSVERREYWILVQRKWTSCFAYAACDLRNAGGVKMRTPRGKWLMETVSVADYECNYRYIRGAVRDGVSQSVICLFYFWAVR